MPFFSKRRRTVYPYFGEWSIEKFSRSEILAPGPEAEIKNFALAKQPEIWYFLKSFRDHCHD